MDVSTSEWSSGCESGWTGYLDETYLYPITNTNNNAVHHQTYKLNSRCRNNDFEEEEDLSMVSDASSGPPHFQEEDEQCIFLRTSVKKKKDKTSEKKSKKPSKEQNKLARHQHQQSYHNNSSNNYSNNLDDTASSAAISYSKMYGNPSNNQASSVEHFMGFSQNLSATQFQGTSAFNNHYAFWQSSHPNNADSAEPSHIRGTRWE